MRRALLAIVFRRPDPALSAALSAAREDATAARREMDRKRQLDGEARFRADLRRPRRLSPVLRVTIVLGHALIGTVAGGFAGHHVWAAEWFGQERGDMVGGLMMFFDELVGALVGSIAFVALGLLLTRKASARGG